jgi:hypothetical protein
MTKITNYLKVLAALLVALAALTAMTMAVAAEPAEAAKKAPAKTTLTIKAQGKDLSGTVESSKLSCVEDREIKLYKQKGKKQNPSADEYIGSDTSERQGKRGVWSTGNTGMSGKFYVRTASDPGCSAAASETIVVKK